MRPRILTRFLFANPRGREYNVCVKLSSLRYSTIKLAIFGSVLLYLGLDLLAFRGPVWNMMYGGKTPAIPASEIVADVYGEPITKAQLNRYEAEQDALAGRKAPEPGRRASMLMNMVRAKLLQIRTRYNVTRLPDFHEKATAEAAALATRAENLAAMEAQLQSQGYENLGHYSKRINSTLQSAALLEQAIEPHITVSDEDVTRVYEQLKHELPAPARRQVKHIFLETLHKDPAEVKKQAQQILARLQQGEDFAAVAKECSQDLHSAPKGGELGVLEDSGQCPLHKLPLFGEDAIPAGVPTLVQSEWGWHILQAGEITPAGTLRPEECRASIRSAIESVRREQALDAWYKSALKEGFSKKRIKINVK